VGINRFWHLAAFLWGFAEATLFFIVPDVLLTLLAVQFGWRRAIMPLLFCLSGAVVGGAVFFGASAHSFEEMRAVLNLVPLVPSEMIARVIGEIESAWFSSMLIGSLSGIPYKVYAFAAAGTDISLGLFLLASALVRPIRWILIIAIAAGIAACLVRAGLHRIIPWIWAAMWIAFYIFYAAVMNG